MSKLITLSTLSIQSFCVLSHFICVRISVTLWTVAHQAPLSMGFSKQESWSWLPFPPPGGLPNPGIKHISYDCCTCRRIIYHEHSLVAQTVKCLPAVRELLLSRLSRVQLCVTPERAAHQAPPSLGLSRQEYWSGLPCPSPGGLPNPGIEPVSPLCCALAGSFSTTDHRGGRHLLYPGSSVLSILTPLLQTEGNF